VHSSCVSQSDYGLEADNPDSINTKFMNQPKPLLVYSNHGFGSYSSYPAISKYLSDCDTVSILRQEPKTLSQRVLNRVVRTFATSQWYKLTSLELEWRSLQHLYKSRPELVHFLWGDRDLGYFNLMNQIISVPLCCTFHCCPDDLPNILPYRKRLRNLDAIVVMSETQRPFFETCGVAADKIHCILHGIDTDFFVPSSYGSSDHFTVLSVGSYKRDFLLLREVALKLRNYAGIHVKIVSSKGFHSYFADLDHVEFVSNLSDSQLLKAYQSSDCLLLTVENATANNALLEGLACGLPIVAEDVGGIGEYVNSDCAVMTQAKDADLLVESIVQLAASSSKCREMAKAARVRAMELSWSKVAARTKTLYQSLV
jgi:glycosyltransferase involved in cell wall biosynthesis